MVIARFDDHATDRSDQGRPVAPRMARRVADRRAVPEGGHGRRDGAYQLRRSGHGDRTRSWPGTWPMPGA